ncbi:MAG: WecB/TagA/CpsF family glycosyltransferase [Candidatus Uhrbacteria bacterium]|nr:WecB/TagA/CpsF family glycosyltransferase [Candidatus Uhrbacteria bacterium]
MPNVFGISIEGCSVKTMMDRLRDKPSPFWIVTANPEILLEARRDPSYANVLRQADLRSVDGFGLWLLLRLFGFDVTRVTGIDLAMELIRFAHDRQWRVGLIGGGGSIAEKAAQEIKKRYPALIIMAENGGAVDLRGEDDQKGEEARHRLTLFDPQVLLVAFGHPKQESWIAKHKNAFPNLKVVIGVGGAFDVWAGKSKRAPTLFRQLGFEWLWRLIKEPRRIKRIWNAVIVFPIRFILDQLT